MIVNERGHIEMADGRTTEVEQAQYYVGNGGTHISFTNLILEDGRVVLHSAIYHGDELVEDFLYEVAERHEAVEGAQTMVEDALDHLESLGVTHDGGGHAADWVSRLRAELVNRLH